MDKEVVYCGWYMLVFPSFQAHYTPFEVSVESLQEFHGEESRESFDYGFLLHPMLLGNDTRTTCLSLKY